jgi:ketosteroid isomerase-like protein
VSETEGAEGVRLKRGAHARLLVATALFVVACGPVAETPGAEPLEAVEIRAARRSFNEAIASRDLDVISALLMPTYHIVTGRSAQSEGHDANVAAWQDMFATDSTMIYVRSTREVRVNREFGLAEELGDWTGSYTSDGFPGEAGGVYAAKWQRATDGRWLLQSEVFTTLECSGGLETCSPPDPVASRR